jgi:hypothetical protein
MRRSRFTEGQILGILKEPQAVWTVGISEGGLA